VRRVVGALPVPHLPARVAWVGQDRRHRAQLPLLGRFRTATAARRAEPPGRRASGPVRGQDPRRPPSCYHEAAKDDRNHWPRLAWLLLYLLCPECLFYAGVGVNRCWPLSCAPTTSLDDTSNRDFDLGRGMAIDLEQAAMSLDHQGPLRTARLDQPMQIGASCGPGCRHGAGALVTART
jgi:hypothetical protein